MASPGEDREGKEPLIKHWSRWGRPPSLKAVETWAGKFTGSNVGIVPGASDVPVAIVDVDDASQIDAAREALGDTPLQVATSRGGHLYYKAPDRQLPGTLRALGIKGELKFGASIVIAPPSLHKSGKVYTLIGGHWVRPKDLPLPRLDWLDKANEAREFQPKTGRGHSRRHTLNDWLCKHAAFCDTLDELLDVARTRNDEGWPTCDTRDPMPDARVMKIAAEVWRDHEAGNLEAWIGRKSGRGDAELMALCEVSKHGANAFALLTKLRAEHSARCRRGETFVLSAPAMAKANVIPGWGRWTYIEASALLVEAGYIEMVRQAVGRTPAEYRLGGPYSCIVTGIQRPNFLRERSVAEGRAEVSEAKRLKALEEENRRLKKLLAEQLLDNAALKDLVGKNF